MALALKVCRHEEGYMIMFHKGELKRLSFILILAYFGRAVSSCCAPICKRAAMYEEISVSPPSAQVYEWTSRSAMATTAMPRRHYTSAPRARVEPPLYYGQYLSGMAQPASLQLLRRRRHELYFDIYTFPRRLLHFLMTIAILAGLASATQEVVWYARRCFIGSPSAVR